MDFKIKQLDNIKFYHAELNGSEKALVDQFIQLTGKKP
jgi:hypothetical protein